ncbi:site-specific integrase [Pontixanthobacter aestiaquae]|uniref:Tyrosine-type recombinase/integrase n=1 Tax=Pontixanthobacter aestiaquae TaxID=1509367 RepID=A0A844Z3X0_9SPHN|nr:site-specific integrase [Pontixanthobacter aestiaquae]MDN3646814.1 site-specific integrase [Pontixanthobacter aestiaquae]MXO82204.1 tyrosine-type recombinase/integrase [Pontixanthobacter aestiaquae]
MASINKRGSSWFVQIRRKGFRPRFKSFESHSAAQQWAREEEAAIDNGHGRVETKRGRETTVSLLLNRYSKEVAPKKKGAVTELLRLAKMQDAPFAQLSISNLTGSALADYRDHRLNQVKPTTVRRELGIIRSVLEIARKEWGVPLRENPVAQISIPAAKDARERRLKPGELEALLAAIDKGRNPLVRPLVLLALETALRRGELLRLTWKDIDLDCRTALIRDTKNGSDRTIPLTKPAATLLEGLGEDAGFAFPLTPNALRQSWRRACHRAEIQDLRFHDLRHEAISRFFEIGLSVPEVALISGHRDARMLFRYTHLAPNAVRDRIDKLSNH